MNFEFPLKDLPAVMRGPRVERRRVLVGGSATWGTIIEDGPEQGKVDGVRKGHHLGSVVKSDPCFTGGPLSPFWGRRLDSSSRGSTHKMTHGHHSRPCVDQNNITGALEVDFKTIEDAFN